MGVEAQEPGSAARLCLRCKEQNALYEIRSEPACGACFAAFVRVKVAKRFEVVDRESRSKVGRGTAHYLIGLSLGPSSSAMVNIFDELDERSSKKQRPVSSSFRIVHVDTSLVDPPSTSPSRQLGRWEAAYPRFTFETVPLTAAFSLPSIDWHSLPRLNPDLPPDARLRDLFDRLPSSTSRADATRLFVRHILISAAAAHGCCALLLGNNTTSLAALTLAETAKGRGFSLPWLTNDGAHPVMAPNSGQDREEAATTSQVVHFPLRELYRKELVTYAGLVEMGKDKDLGIYGYERSSGSIVSHKDQSIDDVMARYFEDIELSYPSVVANVVRTTAKLSRGEPRQPCGLCGAAIDLTGNQTWKGEMGDVTTDISSSASARPDHKLCYGCDRSING
ncbi:hypothetical protein RB601_006369 [Gaeumannomyces tritici]